MNKKLKSRLLVFIPRSNVNRARENEAQARMKADLSDLELGPESRDVCDDLHGSAHTAV